MNTKDHMRSNGREISAPEDLLVIPANGTFASIAMCRENELYPVTLCCGFDRQDRALYCRVVITA